MNKCPYIKTCTLYRLSEEFLAERLEEYKPYLHKDERASALTKEVRKEMCENTSPNYDGPVIPLSGGCGSGSGTYCEAYLARKQLDNLEKKLKEMLKISRDRTQEEKSENGTI